MTSAPDAEGVSADIVDPTLPRDPAEYAPPRRPGFGAAFWASIIIGLILIAAGAIIGFFGARLFPVHPAAQPSAPQPLAEAAVFSPPATPPDLATAWQPGPARLNSPPRSRRH